MENFCFLCLVIQEYGDMLANLKADRMKTDKIHSLQEIILSVV